MAVKLLSATADTQWGYEFGVDGACEIQAAADFLGVSTRTVERIYALGRIRKGKHPTGKRVFCLRSIREYIGSLEV